MSSSCEAFEKLEAWVNEDPSHRRYTVRCLGATTLFASGRWTGGYRVHVWSMRSRHYLQDQATSYAGPTLQGAAMRALHGYNFSKLMRKR